MYELNESVRIYKPGSSPERMDRAIRLYKYSPGTWMFQIRGPLGIGAFGARDGKTDIIAGVKFTREQLADLRAMIDETLTEWSV